MDSGLIFPPSVWRLIRSCVTASHSPRLGSRVAERPRPICCRSVRTGDREKRVGDKARIRTKTDTGRRGEYPQALERTVLKELGKFTP